MVGVGLGALVSGLISVMDLARITFTTVVDIDSVLLAVVISAGVGLFFGS